MTPPPQPLDLLVIAAHPDDAEISVGGTIAVSRRQGMSVGILDMTDGEPTPRGTPEQRAAETARATETLDVCWRANLGLPNRRLEHDLDSRRSLAGALRLCRPQVILAPYWEDAHPDHVAASALVDAARFWAKLSRTDLPGEPYWPPRLYYYWSIHLRIHPKPAFVVDISDAIEDKLAAVRCYESQISANPADGGPSTLDDIRDRARYWGWTIGKRFGEPFASREEIGVKGFAALA